MPKVEEGENDMPKVDGENNMPKVEGENEMQDS